MSEQLNEWLQARICKGEWAMCTCNDICPHILYPRGSPFGNNACPEVDCTNTYEKLEDHHDQLANEEREKEEEIRKRFKKDETEPPNPGAAGSSLPPNYTIMLKKNMSEAVVKVFNEFIVSAFADEPSFWEKHKDVLGPDPIEAFNKFSAIYYAEPDLKIKRLNAIRNSKQMKSKMKTDIQILENLVGILDGTLSFVDY